MERKMDFWTIEISTKFKDKSMAERLQKALIDKFNYECNKNKDYMAQVAVGISNINSNYVNGVYNDRLKDGGRPRKVKDILDETNFSKMIYGKCEKDWHVHILALTSPSETLARIIKNYIDKNWNVGVSYKKFKYNGNKAYWEDKDEKFWKKMSNVFTNQVSDLEMLVPEFKIASAVIHYDESSPHLHIVGIPIKEKNKYGMELQVGKSDVFTKNSLLKLQDKMRILCIEEFNKEYNLSYSLKQKQKGRNQDINVKDMEHYSEMQNQIESNKSKLEK